MKIKKLIKELNKLDSDLEVILASDAEGNSYHILDEVSFGTDTKYLQDDNGEIIFMDEECEEYGTKLAVVLYPK